MNSEPSPVPRDQTAGCSFQIPSYILDDLCRLMSCSIQYLNYRPIMSSHLLGIELYTACYSPDQLPVFSDVNPTYQASVKLKPDCTVQLTRWAQVS